LTNPLNGVWAVRTLHVSLNSPARELMMMMMMMICYINVRSKADS